MIKYEITFEASPADEKLQILNDGLDEHMESLFRNSGNKRPFLRDEEGLIVGGVHGNYGEFGWLHISTLWVSEKVRGNDFGTLLMKRIESEAIKAGCRDVYLDTFSFQAPEFYKKLGYAIFGELESLPDGSSKIFFRKRLIPAD